MSDYIERDKIMNFCNAVINRQGNEEEMNVIVESFKAFAEYVKTLPSAQPERKKGKWINKDGGLATCSACGERWGVWSVMNYCPNCGANMRGEENE